MMDISVIVYFWTAFIATFPLNCLSAHLGLAFDLELMHVAHECRNRTNCTLPYFVALLESDGTYDLKAVMLQDGHLRQTTRKRHLRENTVVSLPRNIHLIPDKQLYVGIKIYGMPPMTQDYFVLDASKALKHPTRIIRMSVESNGALFRGRIEAGKEIQYPVPATKACTCIKNSCGCCEHLRIPKIHLDDTGCVNITYLPKPEYGISFTFSINGYVLYNETVSARNPPPICLDVPHLKEYASICLRFHDLHIGDDKFTGCVRLEAELYHIRIAEYELGCFSIPVNSNKNRSKAAVATR